MPATIKAEERNLDKVFSDDFFFEIPFYQRPYAWTTAEVNDLFSDLSDAMERDKDTPYFLGSVVLVKSEGDTKGDVVDGQQRLTTLTILFCVLRELSSNNDSKDDLDKYIRQSGNQFSGIEDRFRLSLRAQDKEFFQNNVQTKAKLDTFLSSDTHGYSDSQLRIRENAALLKIKLGERPEDERNSLAKYIVQNCYLVIVSASDRDSAHRIFSVMNDRGLDLSPTDILKAAIIDKVPSEAQATFATDWEGIEEAIGREDFRNLFTHIRMIYRKEKLRESLQREFEDHILEKLSAEEAGSFVNDVLEPYANVYVAVSRNPDKAPDSYPKKVKTLLQYLQRLDNRDWIPPAMEYFRRYKGNQEALFKFTRDLERLAYALFIRRANINERINRYAKLLEDIEQHKELFDESSPLQLLPEERKDFLGRLEGDIYNQPRIPMPLLLRVDSLLADGTASYQHPAISIEHVLPRHPAGCSQWLNWFPNDEERSFWTHRLANLVLLSHRKNSSASNYEFDRKKQEYFLKHGTTLFALTTRVVNESEWTPKVLKRRQSELIETIKKEWRLG
jgi:hypothetical protein